MLLVYNTYLVSALVHPSIILVLPVSKVILVEAVENITIRGTGIINAYGGSDSPGIGGENSCITILEGMNVNVIYGGKNTAEANRHSYLSLALNDIII